MKGISFSIAAIAITALAISIFPISDVKKIPAGLPVQVKKGNGIVVMELFTSQGCSSCPPAEEILGKYAGKNDPQIFPLAFHVDYWNRLGWVDPFSSGLNTRRQHDYAERLGLESVYTPQLILNGRKELVGSDDNRIASLVSELSMENSAASINFTSTSVSGNQVLIAYSINDELPDCSVNAALVQATATTTIRAGENKGLNVTEHNVVRDFAKQSLLTRQGKITVQIPKGKEVKDFSIVLFIQDARSGSIVAAARKVL